MYKYLLFVVSICCPISAQLAPNVKLVTGSKDIDIIINDSLIGCYDSVEIYLESGKYSIVGIKERRFNDYEFMTIKENKKYEISLFPRSVNMQIEASMIPVLYFDNHNMASVGVNPGVRFKNCYFAGHFSTSFLYRLNLIGVHGGYLYDYKNIFSIGLGAFFTYYNFQYGNFGATGYYGKGYPENIRIHYYGVSSGPEIKLHAGLEHVFFTANFYSLFFKGFVPIISFGFNYTL